MSNVKSVRWQFPWQQPHVSRHIYQQYCELIKKPEPGLTMTQVAKRFNINYSTFQAIIKREMKKEKEANGRQ